MYNSLLPNYFVQISDNAQCFIQLMVLEGKTKMGSTEIKKPSPIQYDLIRFLILWENIEVSKSGKAYLENCILKDQKWKITVNRQNKLRISGKSYHEDIWNKIPYSKQFITEIGNLLDVDFLIRFLYILKLIYV
jgi:hypothetical protein